MLKVNLVCISTSSRLMHANHATLLSYNVGSGLFYISLYSSSALCCVKVSKLSEHFSITMLTEMIRAYPFLRRRRLFRRPNSIWASTNQGQGQGSILLPPRATALSRLDAGSGGVKPTSSRIIQNLQTSCSSWYMMYET